MSVRNSINYCAGTTIVLVLTLVTLSSITTEAQVKQVNRNSGLSSRSQTVTARPFHHGNMIDVSRSNLFTDFSDTINSTVSSGQIFNNATTGNNGGFFHLGTFATDAYWGAASSTGGSPFAATLANSAIFFGDRDNIPLQFLTSNAIRVTIAGSGNVGIGTTNPTSLFQVLGNTSSSSLIQLRNQNTTAGTSYGMFVAAGTNSSDYVLALRDAADNDLVRVLGNGNFGIGTTSPSHILHVQKADSSGAGILLTSGSSSAGGFTGYGLGRTNVDATWAIASQSNDWLTGSAAGDTVFGNYGATKLHLMTNQIARLSIDGYGNVGIGTTTPEGSLDVRGTYSYFGAVQGYTYIANDSVNFANSTDAAYTGWINYYGYQRGFTRARNLSIGNGAGTAVLTVDGGYQRVGIGTTSPAEKLEVSGNIKVSQTGSLPGNITADGTIEAGNIKAKYQDVAEWVPSSKKLSAGTVVVLDSTKSNQVTSSTTSYDTRVAGVVSEQPGIALGEKSENKVLVATTGRVRVKVDATKGPIHIGDLLVTSDVPGLAMKSEPVEFAGRKMHMPGTLIGKALEPLEKGTGEILVLLSLQ